MITHEMVSARNERARQALKRGEWAAAFEDLRWCYEEGMVAVKSFAGVRLSYLLGDFEQLLEIHPPAKAWMCARRDEMERRLRSDANEQEAGAEFAALNDTLGEAERTLAFFDEFPPGDGRRHELGHRIYWHLRLAQRYHDALEVTSLQEMMRKFEEEHEFSGDLATEYERLHREYMVRSTANDIEVLAGAGMIEQAQALARQVLDIDSSAPALALLTKHVSRAGQPLILDSLLRR